MEDFFKSTIQTKAPVDVDGRRVHFIEAQSTPKRLFKYRPLNEYTRKMLSSKEIYHAGRESFNDPLDGINSYRLVFTPEEMTSYTNMVSEGRPPEEAAIVRSYLQQNPEVFETTTRESILADLGSFGISCFSAKADNFLMWSHYAQEHHGVCMEFDFTREIQMVRQPGFSFLNSYMLNMRKVVYTDSTAIVNLTSISRDKFSPVYHKSRNWEYEEEYRSVRPAVGVYSFDPSFLQAVYFGMRTTQKEIDEIRKLIDQSGYGAVVFKKMIQKSQSSYDLTGTDL